MVQPEAQGYQPVSRNETSEQQGQIAANISETRDIEGGLTGETVSEKRPVVQTESSQEGAKDESKDEANLPHIKFAPDPRLRANEKGALYIPGPRERDNGEPITMTSDDEDEDQIKPIADSSYAMRRTKSNTRSMRSTRSMSKATSVDRVVSSMFVLGSTSSATRSESKPRREPLDLSSLTPEELGGVEYRALRVLLKITIGTSEFMQSSISEANQTPRVLFRPAHLRCHLSTPMDPSRTFQIPGPPRFTWCRQDMVGVLLGANHGQQSRPHPHPRQHDILP
ncbi:Potassium transport protein 1 [Pyrenophora tritici-repentis]|nr:Potassium transport protein 1 [Pyrenophora tritici-repentis]